MRVLIFSVLIAFSLAVENLPENGSTIEAASLENKDEPLAPEARALPETDKYTIINPQPFYTSNVYPSLQPIIRSAVRTHEPQIVQLNQVIVPNYVPYTTTAHIVAPTTYIKTVSPIVEVQPVVSGAIVDQALLTEKTQYHSQDELGRATYGHAEPLQTHNAYQDENGGKSGSFSYIAPNGKLLTTTYSADANGYRAKTNALPIHNKAEEVKSRRRRSVVATAPLSVLRKSILTQVVNNPGHAISYRVDPVESNEKLVKTVAYQQPLVYSAYPAYPYSTPFAFRAQPIFYNSVATIPAAYQKATLTNIVHTPGHAASYRVDPN